MGDSPPERALSPRQLPEPWRSPEKITTGGQPLGKRATRLKDRMEAPLGMVASGAISLAAMTSREKKKPGVRV